MSSYTRMKFWLKTDSGRDSRERSVSRRRAKVLSRRVPATRKCKACGKRKRILAFRPSHLGRYGREGKCRDCTRGRNKAGKKRYENRHWERILAYRATRCNRVMGHDCDIDGDFVMGLWQIQGGKCYWFGVPLLLGAGNYHPQKPSLDRLDGAKPYSRDNVVLACRAANMGRNDSDAETFHEFVNAIKMACCIMDAGGAT